MSQVLRKKIDSATGVPQILLRMPAFWDQIRGVIGEWTLEFFGAELRPVFDVRRVVSGKAALDALVASVSYRFPSDGLSGLAGISFDRACVSRYASARLKETDQGLEAASPLLLKLVCEELAVALRRSVAASFGKTERGSWESPTESVIVVAGQFAPSTRYLLVEAKVPLQPASIRVSLFFALDPLKDYARQSADTAARNAARVRSRTPAALKASVKKSMVEIDAVLDRLTMSIGDCSRLHKGQVIALPSASLARLPLSAETLTGKIVIAQGAMGVFKHNRAVKLAAPVDPDFVRNFADI